MISHFHPLCVLYFKFSLHRFLISHNHHRSHLHRNRLDLTYVEFLPTLSHSISILSYLPHLPPLIISNTNFIKVPTNNSRNFIIPNIHFTSNRTPRNMVRIIKPPLAPFTYVPHNRTITFYIKTLLLCLFLFFFILCRFH